MGNRQDVPPPSLTENEQIAKQRADNARLLDLQRASSGGLSDDPTESGEPVKDTMPMKLIPKGKE